MVKSSMLWWGCRVKILNDPCRTRTCNPLIKSQLLCQIELTGQRFKNYTADLLYLA